MELTDKFLNSFQELDFPQLGYIKIPPYLISPEEAAEYKVSTDIGDDGFLLTITKHYYKIKKQQGLIPKDLEKQYIDRIKSELDVYKNLKFSSYILLVYSIIQFCKKNSILNSPSRGSCSGSLVLYVIGVTGIDPIKHGLPFERFISASRTETKEINGQTYLSSVSLPDVDIDSDIRYKPLINKYLEDTFPNRTCKILNMSTLQGKILIKECGKVVAGRSDDEMTKVTELIEVTFGKVHNLESVYEESEEFKKWCDQNKLAYDIALKLRGLNRNKSVHASGIFISDNPLGEACPTELDSEKRQVLSYDMHYSQYLGIKIDNLGLKNLSIIKFCLGFVNRTIDSIDVNDPIIYQFINLNHDYYGIFQANEGLGKKTLQQIQAKNIDDIALSISLGRPGSMAFIKDYCKFRHEGDTTYLDGLPDDIRELLKTTGGIIVFQEDLMALCRLMAHFTPSETNDVRKAVAKKTGKILEWKDKFINQSIKNGYSKEVVEKIWGSFEASGNYLFSKNHAYGYAYLTAITAYLKAKYPLEFFLSLLQYTREEQDPVLEISKIHKEMQNFGIQLLRPHLIKSQLDFSVENGNIRFGLLSIKGISDKSIEKLNCFRGEYSTKFEVFEGANTAGLNNNILCSLIQAGCFEGFAQSRTQVVYEAQLWNILSEKEKKLALALEKDFNYDLVAIVKELARRKDEKSKPLIKESRLATIKKHAEPYKHIYNLNSKYENFANYFFETTLLGYAHGKNLREIFLEKNPRLITIKEIKAAPPDTEVFFVATVESNAANRVSKNDNKYMTFDVSDDTDSINVKIFSKNLESALLMNNGKSPKKGQIVMMKGIKKEGNCIFGIDVGIQNNKIFTRFAQVKEEERVKKEEKKLTKT